MSSHQKFQVSVLPEDKDKVDAVMEQIDGKTAAESLLLMADLAARQLEFEGKAGINNKNLLVVQGKLNQVFDIIKQAVELAEQDKAISQEALTEKTSELDAYIARIESERVVEKELTSETIEKVNTEKEDLLRQVKELSSDKETRESLKSMFEKQEQSWIQERQTLNNELERLKNLETELKETKTALNSALSEVNDLKNQIINDQHKHEMQLKEAETQRLVAEKELEVLKSFIGKDQQTEEIEAIELDEKSEYQAIIKEMKHKTVADNLIAKHLNDQGIKHPDGKKWTAKDIKEFSS